MPGERRLPSIDVLRGLVMVIMALDHVRDMTMRPSPATVDFSQASLPLFFTRWITHLCAPTFILLAGVGAWLYGAKGRRTGDVSRFLLTRGLWLVVVELTVVNLAWNFTVGPRAILILQVIWAIGWSMVALAALVWLPRSALAVLAVATIAGHNLLDRIQPPPADASLLWTFVHVPNHFVIPGVWPVFAGYVLVPWFAVMALGYVLGPWFARADDGRARRLVWTGLGMVLAFVVLRAGNCYGEPVPWTARDGVGRTLVGFLNLTKYPPSLQFLLMTLGPALVLLGWLERVRGPVADALGTIGRVPFFYYVAHLYLIHAVAIGLGVAQGLAPGDVAVSFVLYPKTFGVGLATVYVFWLAVVVALYPPCRWFAEVKARRREWWLSYL